MYFLAGFDLVIVAAAAAVFFSFGFDLVIVATAAAVFFSFDFDLVILSTASAVILSFAQSRCRNWARDETLLRVFQG